MEKAKTDITELVFILDRSGSMAGLESDTIGGFNASIEIQKEKYGWEFLFIGANIDSVETAKDFGIGADRAVNCHADPKGTEVVFNAVANTVCMMRKSESIDNWSESITEDYNNRR